MIGAAVVVDVRSLIETVEKGKETYLTQSPVFTTEFLKSWELENGEFCPNVII